MKSKHIIYIFTSIVFLAYLASAGYIFNVLIPVNGESLRTKVRINNSFSNSYRVHIDNIGEAKIKWKEMIMIKGWAVNLKNENQGSFNRYLVLKSKTNTYVFDINNNATRRVDVARTFSLNNQFIGFEAFISWENIRDGKYRIGIMHIEESEKHLTFSNDYITIKKEGFITGFVSSEVNIPLSYSETPLRYFIQSVEDQGDYLLIQGWGFMKNVLSDYIHHYIIFRDNDDIIIFDTANIYRQDVADRFYEFELNPYNIGFKALIPKEVIPEGDFNLGLHVHAGERHATIIPVTPRHKNSFSFRNN